MAAHSTMLPVEEVLKGAVKYVPLRVGAPRASGLLLKIFVWFVESQVFGRIVLSYFMRLNRVPQMLSDIAIPDAPMFLPEYPTDFPEEPATVEMDASLAPPLRVESAVQCLPEIHPAEEDTYKFRFWSIRNYADAYRSNQTTPTQVAERFISAVKESEKRVPPMGYFISFDVADIRMQALASSQRFAAGTPLSILDGILVAVKDDIDCIPHDSRGGTKWLHNFRPVKHDAVCVARLRECGVIFAGKTNMHELGMGTTGNNPFSGTVRNPYDVHRYTGGSSAGSAAVVASGLCPVSLGTDAGGSIRIPSALCGVVGLKSTFGRTTLSGLVPVGWTLESVGPIAANVEDAMIAYSAMVGSIPSDVLYSKSPSPRLPKLGDSGILQHMTLGIYSDWFWDVSTPEVAKSCKAAVEGLQQTYGTQVMEIVLPELEELRNAHIITTGSEICTCLNSIYKFGRKKTCYETRVTLALFKEFRSSYYIAAQRVRRRVMYYHMEMLKKVNVIVTPTTGITAPLIPQDAIGCGETDIATNGNLMRFIVAGNFLGLPAISIPVGHDAKGLPIGIQLIGRPWEEASLLHVARAIEKLCAFGKRQPSVFFDILNEK